MYFKSVWDPGAFRDLDFYTKRRNSIQKPSAPSHVGVGQFSFSSVFSFHHILGRDTHVHSAPSESRSTRSFHSALKMGRGLVFFLGVLFSGSPRAGRPLDPLANANVVPAKCCKS